MRINELSTFTCNKLTDIHAVAVYGLDSFRDTWMHLPMNGFDKVTDLTNSVPESFGERVINAIASYGITGVGVDSIECGPVITRINLALPRGVRCKSIVDLATDLAMQLHVASVSFTPVPERGVLALDVPAENRKVVLPGNVHGASKEGMALPLELGVTVTGAPKAIDLAKAPHLLIAGQTGSGKSVCINSIICSLVHNVPMADMQLMLVDPKGVELNDYKELPNVINNQILVSPLESLEGLRWLCDEMERRYGILTKTGHRNIKAYNEWVKTQPVGVNCKEKMRYIVCVVDEFADLMMTAGAELTAIVQRLAQKSRAVGIHLVLATQRPSVKVVTGDLKANLPCRIAFKVSSSTDSTTILGHGGAEHLLGMGDMILSNNDNDERLHGVYMDDEYIRNTVKKHCEVVNDTLLERVNYATSEKRFFIGDITGVQIPEWLFETMKECRTRPLDGNAPSWLASLVRINKAIWSQEVTGMITLIAGTIRTYKEVNALNLSTDLFAA